VLKFKKNSGAKGLMTLASHENDSGHLRVFLESCQIIADLSDSHQISNMKCLFKQSKNVMTNACRETGYAKVHNIKATTQG
jgi:hypothetical protein